MRLSELDGQGPLHRQIVRAVGKAIRTGRVEGPLPSTRELAQRLGVSRNTVRAAYAILQADGWLVTKAGSRSRAVAGDETARRALNARAVAPQSSFSGRTRALTASTSLGRLHQGLRFNLQYGEPLTDVRFTDLWRKELGRAAAYTSLEYPVAQGLPALRSAIARHLRRWRGLDVAADDVLVVAGTQQALSLSARVLLDEGDTVVLEHPGYFFTYEVMQAHGAAIIPVPVDRNGLVVQSLPAERPDLVCVTPAHQFPLGVILSAERRSALIAYARRHDTWILEDDYDALLQGGAIIAPALRSEDPDDRVIHVGSFSKLLAPSLRLAYLVMPRSLRRDFIMAKRLADLGCPAIEQAAMASLLQSGALERHLARVVKALKDRREALLTGLARHVGPKLHVTGAGAGMHLVAWWDGATPTQETEVIEKARLLGVGLHPLSGHYAFAPRQHGLLLGYAGMAPAEIDAACVLLGRCIDGL